MKALNRAFCVITALILIMSGTPLPARAAEAAQSTAAPAAKPIERTAIMESSESEMRAEAESAGGETLSSSGFSFRLTKSGYAVITGYDGEGVVTIPLKLSGAYVTAIAGGAFGADVTSATVHGNVLYIHPSAFAGKPVLRALHGSYALWYAQSYGLPSVNETDGELMPGVIDLNDLGDQATVLSSTLVSVSPVTARRLTVGSLFMMGDAAELMAFRATAMKENGGKVLVQAETPEVGEVIINMVMEGVIYSDMSDFVPTEYAHVRNGAAQLTEKGIQVFETAETDSKDYSDLFYDFSVGMDINYKTSSTAVTRYRVDIVDNKIVSGMCWQDTSSVNELSVSWKKTIATTADDEVYRKKEAGEFKKMMKQLQDDAKAKRWNDDNDYKKVKLGYFPVTFGIWFYMDIEIGAALTFKGTGIYQYKTQTISQQHFDPAKDKWIDDEEYVRTYDNKLEFMGNVSAKVYLTITMGTLYGVNLLELEFAIVAEIELNAILDKPFSSDFEYCLGFRFSVYYERTTKAGIWVEAGGISLAINVSWTACPRAKNTCSGLMSITYHRPVKQPN